MKKVSVIIICILALILVGLFYWFEWRPAEIVEACHKYAVQKASEDLGEKDRFRDEDYNFRYKYCLNSKGLR